MLVSKNNAATVDEDNVGENVLDFFDLMGSEQNGAVAVEVIGQKRIVELFAEQQVETQRRFVEHQKARVDRHNQRKMKLRHHPFRKLTNLGAALDCGFGHKFLRRGRDQIADALLQHNR